MKTIAKLTEEMNKYKNLSEQLNKEKIKLEQENDDLERRERFFPKT